MRRPDRGLTTLQTLACCLVLAQGATGGGFCQRNPPAGKATESQGGTITQKVEEVPDDPNAYVVTVPDLGPVGPITLEETGSAESLKTPNQIAEAESALLHGLQSEDAGDRYLAVDGLINAPWSVARPLLEAAVADADEQVVMLALQQLSYQADPANKALLQQYLDWDDLWRPSDKHQSAYRPRQGFLTDASPIEALARMQDPAVEPLIREKLSSPDDVVLQIQGIRLAERYGTAKFTEELAVLFNGEPSSGPPYHAARALYLANINREQAERFLVKGMNPDWLLPPIVVSGMAKELGRKDWEPHLRKLMTAQDPTTRGQALEALGALGLPLSATELQIVLTDLDARGRLMERIDEWADPATMIPLLEAGTAPGDQDYYIIQLALARLGSQKAIDTLVLQTKQRDSDGQWIRESVTALNALAELDHPQVAGELALILNAAGAPVRVQYACLQGLGRLMDPASLPTLVRYYRNYSAAQPGLAAYAASIALALTSPELGSSQPPAERMIWPLPAIGRFAVLYHGRGKPTGIPTIRDGRPIGGTP